ncbi:radical SAM protein [Paenibacillus sp. Y412MC10]|uniref:radical SAM protein n=1 Tax=Geobacillus sp. (strain Y412MC10) TaxID=481743 RepID=UPI0011AB3479|nr:radical SAM protein [Paenibacillus sp. Y412MC10]
MTNDIVKPVSNILEDNRFHSNGCEVNIVHQCNLSCRGCSHLSPVADKMFISPDIVYRDLSLLSKYYTAKNVRLLGGEPLLHRDLLQVIDAVRASTITNCIRILTNGVLLSKMTDAFWESVDEVYVSLYPEVKLDPAQLEYIEIAAREYNVSLEIREFSRFREAYSEIGTYNEQLVQRIYNTCQIAHVWKCHTIHDGRFYRCPQSVFLRTTITEASLPDEGLIIDSGEDFGQQLKEYLERDLPFKACTYCLGSAGKAFTHTRVARNDWRGLQNKPTEELLDQAYLERLEQDIHSDFNCIETVRRQ